MDSEWVYTMSESPAERSGIREPSNIVRMLQECGALVESLYVQSSASRWGLPRSRFRPVLSASVQKQFAGQALTQANLEGYLAGLHLEDLALAAACMEGCEAAWEHFVAVYRGYLRATAASVLRCPADSPKAQELADSLFAEFYGLSDKNSKSSLFRYFHGRSSLKTWLRTVLVQRHIDAVRARRRFESLDAAQPEKYGSRPSSSSEVPSDPHRERYLKKFQRALDSALSRLDGKDSERLRLYYAEEQTLAQIGQHLGEHESSVSRNLDRIRRELRSAVEELLRAGTAAVNGHAGEPGFSEVEIALCFEYSTEDAPINLDTLLPPRNIESPSAGRRKP